MILNDAYDNYAKQDTQPCTLCRDAPEKGGRRLHFHGSDFGRCYRQVSLKMTQHKEQYSKPTRIHPMFLKDGHVHEAAILEALAKGNTNDLKIEASVNEIELQIKIPFWNPTKKDAQAIKENITNFVHTPKKFRDIEGQRHYILVVHTDAFGVYKESEDDPGTEFGIEIKSVKDETWKKIQGGEIEDSWYGQMQAYMFITRLPRWYLIVKNRISSRILNPIPIDYDPKYVIQRLIKLNQVYAFVNYGKEVPVPNGWTKSNPNCRFCDFNETCWK